MHSSRSISQRYEILDEIARGSFGVVLRARNRETGQLVAIKRMLTNTSGVESSRFMREARIALNLEHPHVVRLLDMGADTHGVYQVLELIEGGTLRDLLRAGALTSEEVTRIGIDLAEALEHAHCRGVLHRDLKPANVLVDRERRVYLTDFGLATQSQNHTLTTSGEVLGTPMYMAPEQALGDHSRIGPPTDVYGLGATLYAAVTGAFPFQASGIQELLREVAHVPPTPPRRHAEVDPALENVILRCMAKDPTERYPSAGALALALRAAGTPQVHPVVHRAEQARWRPSPLLAAFLGGVVALGLVAGARALLTSDALPSVATPPEPPTPAEPTVEPGPSPGEALLAQAREALRAGQEQDAERLLDRAITAGETSGEAHLERAALKLGVGRAFEAFADLDTARQAGLEQRSDDLLTRFVPNAEVRRLMWITFSPRGEGSPEEGALLISKLGVDPGLDVSSYLRHLDGLAADLKPQIGSGSPEQRLRRFVELTHRDVVSGALDQEYRNVKSACLDQVLERGIGLPITTTLVSVALARRVGIELKGVCYPGHFLSVLPGTNLFVDAYGGKVVLAEELLTSRGITAEHLSPSSRQLILVRAAVNLQQGLQLVGDRDGMSRLSAVIEALAPRDTNRIVAQAFGQH